jgi:hypothetical protein
VSVMNADHVLDDPTESRGIVWVDLFVAQIPRGAVLSRAYVGSK